MWPPFLIVLCSPPRMFHLSMQLNIPNMPIPFLDLCSVTHLCSCKLAVCCCIHAPPLGTVTGCTPSATFWKVEFHQRSLPPGTFRNSPLAWNPVVSLNYHSRIEACWESISVYPLIKKLCPAMEPSVHLSHHVRTYLQPPRLFCTQTNHRDIRAIPVFLQSACSWVLTTKPGS